ncbi:MAG TPA: hypothetical protein ENJ94_03025 [Gammaproteobacteria bacterium]|nr:hypothetical protein [Gammaproteobacteria bacterium]
MDLQAWQLPLAILGLVTALLLTAGLARRYQEHLARQRALLRQLVFGARELEQVLTDLEQVPLGAELRRALRGDILENWRRAQAINPRDPALGQALQAAEARQSADGGATGGRVPAVNDAAHCQRLLRAIDHLVTYLKRGGPVSGRDTERLAAWRRELRERRAEVLARHHVVAATRADREGRSGEALEHLQYLLQQLQQRGPDTDFVRDLYAEAERLCQLALQGRPLQEAADEAEDQRSNRSSAA